MSILENRRALGLLAAGWALAFGLFSFYWALGGRWAVETLGPGLVARADDPVFVAVGLWGAGVFKVGAAFLAAGLVVGRVPLRVARPLRRLLLLGGAAAALYGAASLVQHGLMTIGAIATPVALGAEAARWHAILWDPWWILGGLLFMRLGAIRPDERRHSAVRVPSDQARK